MFSERSTALNTEKAGCNPFPFISFNFFICNRAQKIILIKFFVFVFFLIVAVAAREQHMASGKKV